MNTVHHVRQTYVKNEIHPMQEGILPILSLRVRKKELARCMMQVDNFRWMQKVSM